MQGGKKGHQKQDTIHAKTSTNDSNQTKYQRRFPMLMIEEMETVVAPSAEGALVGVAVGLLLVAAFCS
jgi:hypothetical protein